MTTTTGETIGRADDCDAQGWRSDDDAAERVRERRERHGAEEGQQQEQHGGEGGTSLGEMACATDPRKIWCVRWRRGKGGTGRTTKSTRVVCGEGPELPLHVGIDNREMSMELVVIGLEAVRHRHQ